MALEKQVEASESALEVSRANIETAVLGASAGFMRWPSARCVEITAGLLPDSVVRCYALLCRMQRAPRP
jgi:hypothetical protein